MAAGSTVGGHVSATGGWIRAHVTADPDAGSRRGRRGADGADGTDGACGRAKLDRGSTHFRPQQRRRGERLALSGRRAAGAAGPGTAAQPAGRRIREAAESKVRLIWVTGRRR